MRIAILDPFSGIAGDMMLGALVDVGLDPEWLVGLPAALGLEGVRVRIARVRRGDLDCAKVDFEIPPQPHGRHLREIRQIVARAAAPEAVRERADRAFVAIAEVEAQLHGTTADRVHLHEVGAVDALLDVVGSIWGLERLDVEQVYCGPIALGDGTVRAAHGVLPVPAPATLRLLEGHPVRPGPDGAGELVTPTGAALVKVLSSGLPPATWIPRRSGFGAGTRELRDRANALRITLADAIADGNGAGESLTMLAADIDDMAPEYVAGAADALRAAGALDVVVLPSIMKKGRPGVRVEVLCQSDQADALEMALFAQTTTIGVRRSAVARRALPRETRRVRVGDRELRVKVVTLPDGRRRVKPEYDDVLEVASATGMNPADVSAAARTAAERELTAGVQPGLGATAPTTFTETR